MGVNKLLILMDFTKVIHIKTSNLTGLENNILDRYLKWRWSMHRQIQVGLLVIGIR